MAMTNQPIEPTEPDTTASDLTVLRATTGSGSGQADAPRVLKQRFVLEEKLDALWLPPAAVRTFQGRNFVVVQDEDGSQRRVDVRLGIESEERVEILEGLERGQTVVGE